MFRTIRDELADRKWAKRIVRRLQNLGKHWNRGETVSVGNGTLRQMGGNLEEETFFGYYDRSPLSADGRFLLYHASCHSTKLNPNPQKPISLVLFDMDANIEVNRWTIWAYNWQQGCKPQWLDERSFIFNNYDPDRGYHSVVYDIVSGKERFYPYAHYESCESFFLTLNYNRLRRYRPDYGYRNMEFPIPASVEDGVFMYDFKTGKFDLLVSIAALRLVEIKDSMNDALHKVNHIMLSPSREKFMFMHRWIHGSVKEDRLYVYDLAQKQLQLVADYGMVSHCYWWGDDRIVGYMRGPQGEDGYYVIHLTDKHIEALPDCVQHFGDGHPSLLGDKIAFDTYPDGERRKHLYLYDLNHGTLEEIGKVYEALGYENQCRCDCHPRYINENRISFDSTHTGKRTLCLLDCFAT